MSNDLSDIFEIAAACGAAKKTGRGVAFRCPVHTDRNPSCMAWYGDTAIMVKCFAGCDTHDIVDALRGMGFVLSSREARTRRARDVSQPVTKKPPIIDQDSFKRRVWARQLWSEAGDHRRIRAYFEDVRRLDLGVITDLNAVLRFHPNCPRGKGKRQPAILAAFRDIVSDDLMAVHRIFLTDDNRRDGNRMMLGPCHDTAIKLTSQAATFDVHHFCQRLQICEGVETGIGVLMLFGACPTWALGSAGAIKWFAPLFGVGELMVRADHDPVDPKTKRRPGPYAAQCAVTQWREAGWQAGGSMPKNEGDDYADLAKGMNQNVELARAG